MYGTFMRGYKRVVDGLERIELWISTFLLGVLVLLVLLEVISRYLFNRPFPWVLELSMFLITYIIFIAVPALYKGRSLITIEFVFKRLSEKIQKTIIFLWELLIGFFFVYLMIASYQFLKVQMRYRSPGLDIPVAYFTLPLLLCSISMLIFNLYFILTHVGTFLKGKGE
jgi:TRAP-type C4-dicarboxylate transport system permease small subunit